jgi:hypothetical protein
MAVLLSILALVLVAFGIFAVSRHQVAAGVAFIFVAALALSGGASSALA